MLTVGLYASYLVALKLNFLIYKMGSSPHFRDRQDPENALIPQTRLCTLVTLNKIPCHSEPHFPRARDSNAALLGRGDGMGSHYLLMGHISGQTSGGAGLGHRIPIKPLLQEEGEQTPGTRLPLADLVFGFGIYGAAFLCHIIHQRQTLKRWKGKKLKTCLLLNLL